MDDKPTRRGGGAVVALVVVALVLLPMFYVLLIGPTHWLVRYGHLENAWQYQVYWPVYYVCGKSVVLTRSLHWYLNLWVEPLPVGMMFG